MRRQILNKEINEIQIEYLKLLKVLSQRVEIEDLRGLLDEIQMFWFKKKNTLQLIGDYLFNNKEVYCLTGATIFDIEDFDQNIFFINGDYQVFDDPLPSYLTIVSNSDMQKGSFSNYVKKLKTIIIDLIEDEIRLLESSIEGFYILPLRYSLSLITKRDSLTQITEKLVNHFYKEKVTLNGLANVIDIENIVDLEAIKNIILFEGDDPSNHVSDRIERYKENESDIVPIEFNQSQVFYIILFGNFNQALDIIQTSLQFNIIPFFRSFVLLNNYSIVIQQIIRNTEAENEKKILEEILNKTMLEYLLYFEFSKEIDKDYTIAYLKDKSEQIDFKSKIEYIKNDLQFPVDLNDSAKELKKLIKELILD